MTATKKTTTIDETAKIVIVAKENPRRAGTKAHKLFAVYQNGMTVAQYRTRVLALKGIRPRRARTSLVHDIKRGFVKLASPVAKKGAAK